MKVGRVECKIVVGAIVAGSVQLGRVFRVAMIDLGGCVDGVTISFVRTISRGAKMAPAMPAALTATIKLAMGESEFRTSMPPAPPALAVGVDETKVRPGSGRARTAERKERANEVTV